MIIIGLKAQCIYWSQVHMCAYGHTIHRGVSIRLKVVRPKVGVVIVIISYIMIAKVNNKKLKPTVLKRALHDILFSKRSFWKTK